MQFSDYYQQLVQQRLVQQQILQEAQYLKQEISLRRTRKIFGALCFFLISQSFMVPILPIGPWAIWPCLSDFAIAYLAFTFLQERQHLRDLSPASRSLLQLLGVIILGSTLSYLFYVTNAHTEPISGANFGIFQIYRLLQFTFVFWISTRIPLDSRRLLTLRQMTLWVLGFVCLSILLTFFSIVPLSVIGAHLPAASSIAGPWSFYHHDKVGHGWGTIGYNHAYVAAQVILLTGLYLHLGQKQDHDLKTALILMGATVSCFFTGSRAGFAVMLILALVYWLKKPIYVMTLVATGLFLFPFIELIKWAMKANQSADGFILDRQLSILEAANNPEQLSGRDQIWQQRLDFLEADPSRWIFGSGFGSAVDSGSNAHMLPLHITVETGLVGLCLFVFFFGVVLYSLYRYEQGSKALFLTTLVLLLSSVSQETFYPVPAQGHFLGFYLCCLGLALRCELSIKPNWLLNLQDVALLKTPIVTPQFPFLATTPRTARRRSHR